ncbi:Succinyl-diaminopimelate desuccinylase [Frankliniella fusca]|uniref:Succinyl-diaminopimelate desuccinylase n=1 Tax=Frankliniella fusca TaxID=407009 RepID=A0AAE1H3Z7_9NEOP|nr:Succinyl-diaminopimelate desuccinylase [Frankliniella fusca]
MHMGYNDLVVRKLRSSSLNTVNILNCQMHIVLDVRSNNVWKENAFIFDFKDKACSVAQKNIPGFFKLFFGAIVQKKGSCSVDPGVYVADQQPIDWTFPTFPVMPYGYYRFRLTAGTGKVKAMCFMCECHVIPRAS